MLDPIKLPFSKYFPSKLVLVVLKLVMLTLVLLTFHQS